MTLYDQVRAAGAEEALKRHGLSHCKGASKVGSSTEDWWLEIGAIGTEANDALAEVIVLGIAGRIVGESGGDIYFIGSGDGTGWSVRRFNDPRFGVDMNEMPTYLSAALALIKADYERKATDG